MSLVGTRPPTVDEWDKYELHHRARLATKPGLTGMWQVSGRSNITDFEEVVKLDKQYISEWTMGLDITDCINWMKLEQSSEQWAEKALELMKQRNSRDTQKKIQKAGYDIKVTAEELKTIYEK